MGGTEAAPPAVEDLVGRRPSAYLSLLRNRSYRLWFASSLSSSLGDWTGFVALQALVVSLSTPGSRIGLFALGGVMMARVLPSLVIGPVAGVVADRYDRKRLMVTTDLLRSGLFVGIAFATDLTMLFALTFAVESLSLLYMSAKDATLPNLVRREHLVEANQLNLLVAYGTLPLGAVIATAVSLPLRALGFDPTAAARGALLFDAATFLVAALLIARVRLPAAGRRTGTSDSPGVVAELKEGLRFIRDLPVIRALILGVTGVFFGAGVVVTLGPEFVRSSLGQESTDWFTLMTLVGIGLVCGIAVVPLLTRRLRRERLFPIALGVAGAIAAGIATLPSFPLTLAAGFLLGVAAGVSFVVGYTLLHEHTQEAVRSRTFAAFYTGTRLSLFLSLAVAPFLAGAIGRGTLILGNRVVSMSGVRITILLGALVVLFSAVGAGRAMSRAVRERPGPRLPVAAGSERQSDGLFIAFEGVEGSGKSTQVSRLVTALEAEGREVVVTREPGGAPVAEEIRNLLLDPSIASMTPHTEALLYAAARAEHVARVIAPALEQGKVVVCDRFIDSSLAYQGRGRGLGHRDVEEINRWAIGGVVPDVVVVLHLDPEEGMRRVGERARRAQRDESAGVPGAARPVRDRIESEALEFHREVADGYLELARRDRSRYLVIDASAEAGTVAREIRNGLLPWLPLPDADPEGRTRGRQRPEAVG